jgi:hypothetical protein
MQLDRPALPSQNGRDMKTFLVLICVGVTAFAVVQAQTNSASSAGATTVETLVCVRHGEKPSDGLGQLTCRGLNRALALPKVLLGKFPAPQFVFAPNPTEKSEGGKYNYVRPLMTIEPTAIRCGLPVNTDIGAKEINVLETELQKESYRNATVYIAWEHSLLDDFAKDMVKSHGGDASQVPAWASSDFDTIFVIKITRDHGHESVVFATDHEGLNNLSDDCP